MGVAGVEANARRVGWLLRARLIARAAGCAVKMDLRIFGGEFEVWVRV